MGKAEVYIDEFSQESKLAIAHGVANGKSAGNFLKHMGGWTNKMLSGTSKLPEMNVLELFLGAGMIYQMRRPTRWHLVITLSVNHVLRQLTIAYAYLQKIAFRISTED